MHFEIVGLPKWRSPLGRNVSLARSAGVITVAWVLLTMRVTQAQSNSPGNVARTESLAAVEAASAAFDKIELLAGE